jgi:hypothetical protein
VLVEQSSRLDGSTYLLQIWRKVLSTGARVYPAPVILIALDPTSRLRPLDPTISVDSPGHLAFGNSHIGPEGHVVGAIGESCFVPGANRRTLPPNAVVT